MHSATMHPRREHGSPSQSWENMSMPGNFPDTPDVDDIDFLSRRLKKLGLDVGSSGHFKGEQFPTHLNESAYEGWTLYRGEPKSPGAERTWTTVTICKMPLPQAELADLVQKQKRKSITDAYNELTMVKRQHIDNLIEDRKQEFGDPNYDWICVYISSGTRDIRSAFGSKKTLTISISVVLHRQLKPEILKALRTAQLVQEKKLKIAEHRERVMESETVSEFDNPIGHSYDGPRLGLGVHHSGPQQYPQNNARNDVPHKSILHNSAFYHPHSQHSPHGPFIGPPSISPPASPPGPPHDNFQHHTQDNHHHPQGNHHHLQGHHHHHPQGNHHQHSQGNHQHHSQGNNHYNPQSTNQHHPPGNHEQHSQDNHLHYPRDNQHFDDHHNPRALVPPQGQTHQSHHIPHHEARLLQQRSVSEAPIFEHQQMPHFDDPRRAAHPHLSQLQPGTVQITPDHHYQGHRAQPEMVQIPPPPIGPPQPQPRMLPPPAPQHSHSKAQHDRPSPGAHLPNQGSSNPHPHPGRDEPPSNTRILTQDFNNPNQHKLKTEQSHHPDSHVPHKRPLQSLQHPGTGHDHQELLVDQRRAMQNRARPEKPTHEPQARNQAPRNSHHHSSMYEELPRRQKHQQTPKLVNSRKTNRNEQAIVEQWSEEESDISDDSSYLFDFDTTVSSVTENSSSSGEYDKCDFPPSEERLSRHHTQQKSHGRGKSQSSERSSHEKQRSLHGYRIHERPIKKNNPAGLPQQRGSKYTSESVEIQPFKSRHNHNRPGKLARSETVSYPSRHLSPSSYQHDTRSYRSDSPPARNSRSDARWAMGRRDLESEHDRFPGGGVSARRDTADPLRVDQKQPKAQVGGYTPQRVLDTYEKYDRMKRLDINRRHSYMERQPHVSKFPGDDLSYLGRHNRFGNEW